MNRETLAAVLVFASSIGPTTAAHAQAPLPAVTPPSYPAAELDRIVSPIALYPDPLLAQVLAAATYSPDIPAAAEWAHRAVVINRVPWERAWTNRATYVHPYAVRRYAGPAVEQHHVTTRAEPRVEGTSVDGVGDPMLRRD